MEGDSDTSCNWCSLYSQQRIATGTGGAGSVNQTTALLRSTRMLKRILGIRGQLLGLRPQCKAINSMLE